MYYCQVLNLVDLSPHQCGYVKIQPETKHTNYLLSSFQKKKQKRKENTSSSLHMMSYDNGLYTSTSQVCTYVMELGSYAPIYVGIENKNIEIVCMYKKAVAHIQ